MADPTPTAGRRGAGARLVLAVGLLAALGGCAAPATRPPAPAAPPPVVLRGADIRLPLEAYQASTAGVAELGRGYRALLHRCMARYGIDFPPADPPAAATGPRARNERRYGLLDPVTAAIRGYRVGAAAAPDRPALPDLPTAAQAALSGTTPSVAGRPVPPGGCASQANRDLAVGDPPGADIELAEKLSGESFARSRQDPRVAAVTRQWAACMRAGGYAYAGPFEPAADRRFGGRVSPAETATAAADVRCKQRTNLAGVWLAVEAEYQRALIAAHAPALALTAAALRAELDTARRAKP